MGFKFEGHDRIVHIRLLDLPFETCFQNTTLLFVFDFHIVRSVARTQPTENSTV